MSQSLSQSLSQSSTGNTMQLSQALSVSPVTSGTSGSPGLSSQLSTQNNILTQTLSQTLSQSPKANSLQTTSSQQSLTTSLSQSSTTASNDSQPQTQPSVNSTQSTVKNPVVILDKNRLQELVQEVDPNEQLEEEVEDMLLTIADDFIETLVSTSAMFAKHRKSTTLDVKDVQLALEKNWKMWIPGFGSDDQQRHHKKSFSTEAHKQRMALIKKTIKKF